LLFVVLVLLPTQEVLTAVAVPQPVRRRLEPWRTAHRSMVHESYWRSGVVALVITVPLAVLAVVLGAQVLQSYGFSLFVGAPFARGLVRVGLFGFPGPEPFGAGLGRALGAATLAGLAVLLIGL